MPSLAAAARELTDADIAELGKPRPKVAMVARFRDSHHRLAWLIASGMSVGEAAKASGRSYNGVSMLRNDPAFQDLVATKRQAYESGYKSNLEEAAQLDLQNLIKAKRQIGDRLDEAEAEGETLPIRDLVSINKASAEGLGYGASVNVNLNMDFASMLEKAVSRSSAAKTINAKAAPSPPDSPPGLPSAGGGEHQPPGASSHLPQSPPMPARADTGRAAEVGPLRRRA